MTRLALAAAVACAAVCGAPPPRMDGGDGPTPVEEAAFKRGGSSQTTEQQMLAVSNTFFNPETTLQTAQTADANAQAIQSVALTNLGGCGTVTLNGTTVTINYGPPPGCMVQGGTQISGSASVGVSKVGSALSLAFTFSALVVNTTSLDGSATFSYNGTTFSVMANLMGQMSSVSASLTFSAVAGVYSLGGNSTTTQGATSTSLTFNALSWKPGECYPRAGSLRIEQGSTDLTATFNANTPLTGRVSVTSGIWTVTLTLPAYGKCPPMADAG